MAKCGCQSTSCNCVIQAGPGATVTGTGSQANPYIIGAADTGNVIVHDTPTVDMSIAGDGSTGTPFDISGVVKLSAESGNLITANADGLVITCDDITPCIPPAGVIETGCGLDGTGTVLDPLVVKGLVAWPFACAESFAEKPFCGADGSILLPPPATCGSAQVGLGAAIGMAGFCGLVPNTGVRTRLSTQPNRLNYTNPDTCRSQIIELKASGVIWMVNDGTLGSNPNQYINQLLIGLIINGVDGAVVQQHGVLGNGFINYRIDYPPITLAPGAAIQIGSYVDGQSDVSCHVENSQFQHPNIILTSRTCGG